MKRLGFMIAAAGAGALAAMVTLAAAEPAGAQDAGQIAKVQNGSSCAGCNLFQADLAYHDLPGLDLSGSRLRQADLSLSTMNRARFAKADLSIANAFGGRFTAASFAGANLANANFTGAYLHSADFAGADLSGAMFGGAQLQTAKGLTQAQLNAACGDAATTLPAGLTIPACAH